jgi:hypothetical protein
MTTTYTYLRHIPLPSIQQVDGTAFVFKKGRIGRLTLNTLDLWKGRGRRHDVFYVESVKVPPSTLRSSKINVAGSIIENSTVSVCKCESKVGGVPYSIIWQVGWGGGVEWSFPNN